MTIAHINIGILHSAHVYMYICIYIYVQMYIYTHMYIQICTCLSMFIYIYIYVYTCMYINIYIYIHIHTYTHTKANTRELFRTCRALALKWAVRGGKDGDTKSGPQSSLLRSLGEQARLPGP